MALVGAASMTINDLEAMAESACGQSQKLMKIEYEFEISADLGNMLAPVGDMLKHVNDSMASAGYSEQLRVRSVISKGTITSEHEFNEEQISEMKKLIEGQFDANQPAWKAKVESFRRKSGNVQQSVA